MYTYTTADVARFLQVTPRQVGHLAKLHGLGRKLGRDWQFTNEDLRMMKRRPKVGRPGRLLRPRKGAAR
jgi:hypothetical protein